MPTASNAKNVYSDYSYKSKYSILTGSNNSGITNSGSINTNVNDSNAILNKNMLSSYKNNQTQSNSNFKNNDNNSLVENLVIASSSSKDMFEFNYGDEDSDKSFNISGDSGLINNFNKKRNTTNLNNSKFNLNYNSNRFNDCKSSNTRSDNNCKTINAKNYNTNNNNICINNIVIKNKKF